MFVGLISDTHGVFDPEFRDFLSPVDQIWHAGDFGGGTRTEDEISSFKPLVGVYGNCDGQDLRYDCPEYRYFTCGGMTVLMMHIGGYPGRYDRRARELIEKYRPQLFVCGHSHILKVMYDKRYEMMTINPGACGIQGWHAVRTALRFHIDGGQLHDMEVMNLPRKTSL